MDESRSEEFRAFSEWLLQTMREEKVDALLVSGDIFDSTTPGDKTRTLYCDFLSRADSTGCRYIIVTAGNHDSVQVLQVAEPLLRRHHAHVVARLTPEEAESCLIPLCDREERVRVLVAAVPFLRPHEVALRADAHDAEARRTAYVRGIAACYDAVAQAAERWKEKHPEAADVHVIGMGHLSLTEAIPTRSCAHTTYIGTLESVSCDIFRPVFDYVALGHIHKRQDLDGGRIRYCGSPLPMGFDEARSAGEVLLLETDERGVTVRSVPVPTFVDFREENCTDADELRALLQSLENRGESAPPVWLKLTYRGTDMKLADIYDLLDERAEACGLKRYGVLRGGGDTLTRQASTPAELPTLRELSPEIVFERLLREKQGETLNESRTQSLMPRFIQALAEARAQLSRNGENKA